MYSKCPFTWACFSFLEGGVFVDVGISEICGFYNYKGFQYKPMDAFLV